MSSGVHRQNFVTTYVNNEKVKLRKYYLTMYIDEARAVFCEEVQNVSYSYFKSLKPYNVLPVGLTPREQCKCIIHENIIFKFKALGITYNQ